jgi:hypothetical protein
MGNSSYSTRQETPDMISVLENLVTGVIKVEGIKKNEGKANTPLGEVPECIQPLFISLARFVHFDTEDGEAIRYVIGDDVAYMNRGPSISKTPVRQVFYDKEPKKN